MYHTLTQNEKYTIKYYQRYKSGKITNVKSNNILRDITNSITTNNNSNNKSKI